AADRAGHRAAGRHRVRVLVVHLRAADHGGDHPRADEPGQPRATSTHAVRGLSARDRRPPSPHRTPASRPATPPGAGPPTTPPNGAACRCSPGCDPGTPGGPRGTGLPRVTATTPPLSRLPPNPPPTSST